MLLMSTSTLPLLKPPSFLNPHFQFYPSFYPIYLHSPFTLKPISIFTLQTSALSSPDSNPVTAVPNAKLRAEQFAGQIRDIPAEDRFNFTYSMISELGLSNNVGYMNDLIMGLVIIGELDIALKLFDEISVRGLVPDEWTYSILIRCYCKKNEPDEGKKILDCMMEKGFRPNVVTLTILVNSFCSRGRIKSAFEVVEVMSRVGRTPDAQTYNCVLKGLCFVGRVEEAYKMLMNLKTKGEITREGNPVLDIYSYTAVMDGFCKVGRTDEAMELLEEAIKMGLTPNVITYNTLFNGYSKEGKPRKGIWVLKQMKERGCMPDHISYSTLLHGLLKWRKILAGFSVYKEMVEVGFKVDERMMNSLLKGLCKESWTDEGLLENVEQVFDKMKSWGYTISPDTYNHVSHTFCITKEVDRALVIVLEMVEAGYFPRMVTINRIIRGLCEEERISEALSVLVIVCEANRLPSKISYNYLIDELNRQGDMLGACNVYGAALKLGVIPHKFPVCIPS